MQKTLHDVNENTYPVMAQGSGLINIPKAAQTNVLVKPNNVSFGLIKPNSGKSKTDAKCYITKPF